MRTPADIPDLRAGTAAPSGNPDLTHEPVQGGTTVQSIDALVDRLFQSVPEPAPQAEETAPRVAPQDRLVLDALYAQLISQYLEPIAQLIRMLRLKEHSRDTLPGFVDLLGPVLQLTETLEAAVQSQILRGFLLHLDTLSSLPGPFTYRQIEPLNALFDQLLSSLGPEVRERYLAACFYQRNTNPLLEEIRRIKYIGPRRLQRLYAVGLVTVEAISRATAQEIAEVTGLSPELSQQVINATQAFIARQRQSRIQQLRDLCTRLRLELSAPIDEALLRDVAGELLELLPVIEHAGRRARSIPPSEEADTTPVAMAADPRSVAAAASTRSVPALKAPSMRTMAPAVETAPETATAPVKPTPHPSSQEEIP